jgi:hypothetical protein
MCSSRIGFAGSSMRGRGYNHEEVALIAHLFFRGTYLPRMGRWARVKVVAQNRQTIFRLNVGFSLWCGQHSSRC